MTLALPPSPTFTERSELDPQPSSRGSSAEAPEPDDGLPPIDDPYLRPGASALLAEPHAGSRLSRRAIGSLLSALFLGPPGALLAIVLGWSARVSIDAPGSSLRGRSLATAGLMLGVLVLPTWIVVLGARFGDDPEALLPTAALATARPPAPLDRGAEPPRRHAPAAPAPAPANPVDFVIPKVTREAQVGAITVVDVGVSSTSLAEELAKQRAAAAKAGETMLVMTLSQRCAPCRGVEAALPDPRMQSALAKVRLVRVDRDVFDDDLSALYIPHREYPGFFLLAPDLTPRDGINGGEWDDDIAANIAPVLGPFVRGTLSARRRSFKEHPSSGMRL